MKKGIKIIEVKTNEQLQNCVLSRVRLQVWQDDVYGGISNRGV
jgi:hypothetical protein